MSTESRDWLIRKSGAFYRPERAGYTADPLKAGRYTEAEARAEARVENSITAHHVSEFVSPAGLKIATANVIRYDHGGGRMYFEGADGRREPIADFYGDGDFREYILTALGRGEQPPTKEAP